MRTPDQISVIVPTYNRARLLREALASVLSQSAAVGEVIVVDDGSTDGTSDFVGQIAADEPTIRYVRLEHTNHLGNVRNEGIRRAAGSIIALLDSDDVWMPQRVETQLAAWDSAPAARLAFCNVRRFDVRGPFAEDSWLPPDRDYSGRIVQNLLLEPVALPSALMFDRAVYDSVGPYSARRVNEDYEWLLEAAFRFGASYTARPLVWMRAHEGSRSLEMSLQAHVEYLSIVRAFVNLHPELTSQELAAARRGMANVHLKIARQRIVAGDWRAGTADARRAIALSPRDRRGYALLASALRARLRMPPPRVAE